ncbi:MAG: pyridoxine 5'-phosphate synthase [Alphaproteobacteria bacterium]|nr:pyridoxine 5'-phosphate synthase [Alphaproteobacteria bacterium]
MQPLRLGINIDHVATVRNARGGNNPDPVRAALQAQAAGADGITAHLREDRRHIRDEDMFALKSQLDIPLNFEMAATRQMLDIALKVQPHAVCLVPEKREELTTEGGLNAAAQTSILTPFVQELCAAGVRVSLFVDADINQLDAANAMGAPVVELHTGRYCDAADEKSRKAELARIVAAANYAEKIGLECHAGHGLNFENVGRIAALSPIAELNIGHFLMGEAMFIGLDKAIITMRQLMDKARVAQ